MDLKSRGVAAGVYTQATDVEGEVNGLLTYDRKVATIPNPNPSPNPNPNPSPSPNPIPNRDQVTIEPAGTPVGEARRHSISIVAPKAAAPPAAEGEYPPAAADATQE